MITDVFHFQTGHIGTAIRLETKPSLPVERDDGLSNRDPTDSEFFGDLVLAQMGVLA